MWWWTPSRLRQHRLLFRLDHCLRLILNTNAIVPKYHHIYRRPHVTWRVPLPLRDHAYICARCLFFWAVGPLLEPGRSWFLDVVCVQPTQHLRVRGALLFNRARPVLLDCPRTYSSIALQSTSGVLVAAEAKSTSGCVEHLSDKKGPGVGRDAAPGCKLKRPFECRTREQLKSCSFSKSQKSPLQQMRIFPVSKQSSGLTSSQGFEGPSHEE